jgi:hypothetical protein
VSEAEASLDRRGLGSEELGAGVSAGVSSGIPADVLVEGRQADGFERALFGLVALGALVCLILAAWINPDRRGHGTHEQLGLPPCGMVAAYGLPCPSCGFTTSFALAVRFRFWESLVNQPFGFCAFLLFVGLVPLGWMVSFRGFSVAEHTERWPWLRIMVCTVAFWLLAWVYKLMTWRG